MNIEVFDISSIPLYNGDIEAEGTPTAVNAFKNKIAEADALLIATPEYNCSIPGVLKNAIDWASRPPASSPLNKKPMGIIGASSGLMGTVRAQMHLRQIAALINMYTMNRPEVLITKAHEKFDRDGKLTDENTAQHIRKFLSALAEWAIKFKK